MKDEIIYSLNISDIQDAARKEIGRKLLESEIKIIFENINNNINLYEIVADSITEMTLTNS